MCANLSKREGLGQKMLTREKQKNTGSHAAPPFIHKVATERGKYVFDVNTGEILRVDDVVWEIVEDSYLSETEVIARHSPHFTPGQIADAYQEIRKARVEQGYFRGEHPGVGMALSRAEVRRRLMWGRQLLFLEVTERCNFCCTYCDRNLPVPGVLREGTRDMSWDTARGAIDDFLGHCFLTDPGNEGCEDLQTPSSGPPERGKPHREGYHDPVHVGFWGGEPLLNFPLIKQCTEYTLQRTKGQSRFGLTTNGYLLEGDRAEFLGTHNFRVAVSLDGPASLHDRSRRTRGDAPTHQVVFDNLRAFIRKYPRQLIGIFAVVAPGTDMREVCRYFASADWIPPATNVQVRLAAPPYRGYDQVPPGTVAFPGVSECITNSGPIWSRGESTPLFPGGNSNSSGAPLVILLSASTGTGGALVS